jgi:hypothetical protein
VKPIGRGRLRPAGEEFCQQELVGLLAEYADPETTFWSCLENRPRSRLSGARQRLRGVRGGVPDLVCVFRGRVIFIELKSRFGLPSKAQKQVRAELLGRRYVLDGEEREKRPYGLTTVRGGVSQAMDTATA